ncbi:transposase InsO family protein [Bradyrhizobium sp. AZCC 1588]|uniref:Mu transposase C-terminal domain-containing protein n=1 Tax=unclassified Bradyrhizobium TaxID=2631580 RepID=UPI002FEF9866
MTLLQRRGPTLVERMLIKETVDGGRLFRIVHVDDSGDRIWFFDVNEKTWPVPYDRAALIAGFLFDPPSFAIEYDEPFPIRLSPDDETDSAADRAHDRQWDIILHLLGDEGGRNLLFKSTRKRRIDETTAATGVTRPTVVTAIMRYWQRGMTFNAIRPDYSKCGGPGKPRNIVSGRKVGRPRTITPGVGVSVNDDLRRMMQVGADHYLNEKAPSQQQSLDYVVGLFFPQQLEDVRAGRIAGIEEKPTLRQFGYFLRNYHSLNRRFRARHGQKKFDLEGREILGKGEQNARGPGDKFQIDATIADVYLRSQFDRRRIVGRPVIYFVIDVWSRLIVGIYVGFEGPSWIGAMMALTNMVTPKVEFCREFGIEIDHDQWPSHHAPRAILADRGELLSVRLGRRIVDSLRIQIENTSPGRGDLKSIVERRFGVVPAIFKQFTPGYVKPDFGTRGARDYRRDSAMDLTDFTKIVILAVLEHNRETVDGIDTPTEMTTDGMASTPLNRWKWGIENRSGLLRELRLEDVALAVMQMDSARVTEKGIKFKGGYYSTETADAAGWFSKARLKGEWTVKVSYDPRSLDKLYIWDPKTPRGYEICRLLDPYLELKGKSLFEYEEKELAAKVLQASGEDLRQAKRIETDLEMEKIEQEALAKARAVDDPNASIASQVSAIRSNHAAEKAFQRPIEKIDLSPDLAPSVALLPQTPEDTSDSYEADIRNMLERLEAGDKNLEP